VADDEKERAIEAVLASSKKRPSSPRWLWITASLIGLGCAVAFIVAMVRGGDAGSSGAAPSPTSGSGFPAGLALGVGVGIAIGWFAARRAQSSASASGDADGHSSRSKP
jgi:hypothetical protein